MASQQPHPNDPADLGSESRPLNVGDGNVGFFWLTSLGFAFLTFNSGMAIYHSKGDVAGITFVAASYIDLLLLFYCLKRYKKALPRSPQRDRLKASVWGLTTMLTLLFAYMVMGTARLTLPMACIVFAIAAATGIGAFSVFFEQDRSLPHEMRTLV